MPRIKDHEKERAKERKKRGNRKYGQAKLKHSKKGVGACLIAGGVLLILTLILTTAFIHRGGAATYIGGLGLIALILAWVGVVYAIRGFRERDKNYLTCRIGIAFNVLFVVALSLVFFGGIM